MKFTGPGIMKAETPRSLDNGKGLFASKRPLNGGEDGDTPTKRSNLFIECMRSVVPQYIYSVCFIVINIIIIIIIKWSAIC